MDSRRDFLKSGAAILAVATAKPLFGWQGANNRIRMGVIGMGNRAGRVFDSFSRQTDCQFVVGAEVSQTKLMGFKNPLLPGATAPMPRELATNLPVVGDYRRVLDRNDVDAVLIGTPDFSHAKILVDALAAGKDVYVEKPISNSIPRINMMMDAYTKSNRVVQVGTQQRSWDYFIEAKKVLDGGTLGRVNHVVIQQGGNYAQVKQDPVPVPPGLDWDAWQVDAPKRPFKMGYPAFRGWWEYGSGLVGDWGAHHVDVANWFMNADQKVPIKTAAVGFYFRPNLDPECVYDAFSISWQYDTHIVTFENSEIPRPKFDDPKSPDIEGWGVYFMGENGTLQVNRMGYAVRPYVSKTTRRQGPAPAATAGNVQGVGGGAPLVLDVRLNPKGGVEEDYPLDVHTRNFLDCVKSRNRKTNASMEIGYNSALPCLLALEAMQQNKVLGWDSVARKSKPF